MDLDPPSHAIDITHHGNFVKLPKAEATGGSTALGGLPKGGGWRIWNSSITPIYTLIEYSLVVSISFSIIPL